MSELRITRGYPGSGKTTYARQWLAISPETRARVNRDDIRAMNAITTGVGTHAQEKVVTVAQQAAVRALLAYGMDVIVDDTNLRLRNARDWADLAREVGATFEVVDIRTDLEACIERDFERGLRGGGRWVGDDVIKMMAEKFPISRWEPVTARDKAPERAWEPVVLDRETSRLPLAILVDIDGTLARMTDRGPHDLHRVSEDEPIEDVIGLVHALQVSGEACGDEVIFVSGRKRSCVDATRDWLYEHVGPWTQTCHLFMREDDDNRPDDLVKYDLFNKHVRDRFDVRLVIDDRDKVVRMWRALGLTVAQVAYGDF